MHPNLHLWLIPFLCFLGFACNLLLGRTWSQKTAGWVGVLFPAAAFVDALWVVSQWSRITVPYLETHSPWIAAGPLTIPYGFQLDQLSLVMMLIVTGVGLLIHVYSLGYMAHEGGFYRFFAYLNMFMFFMLLLVLAGNYLLMFIGWEGVGFASYVLIGFFFRKDSASAAGMKAFITNRIGDFGFLIGLFFIFDHFHSFDYTTVFAQVRQMPVEHAWSGLLTVIGLLLFVGATGKSAQIPLYVWLSDAMEGPTPVSALIHAATMVTAGVYLMCRISPLLHVAPDAAHVVAIIGGITAFVGATIACAQNDVKKILAYSTISQLGYMFLAAGSGAYVAAIFLMLTHAFYKALLFLGAGSVIHAMNDEQDTKTMGALARYMPLTSITFLVAWLAIGGVPPLSGFWSKSQVLEGAWAYSPALWAVGAVTAILTAYYIGRCYMLVFRGEARWTEAGFPGDGRARGASAAQNVDTSNPNAPSETGQGGRHGGELHPHDPGWVMSVPLVVLAVASLLAGFINLPFHPNWALLERWLSPVVGAATLVHHFSSGEEWAFAIADAVFALVGVAMSVALWRSAVERPAAEPVFLQRAWYIDWAYDRFLARPSTRGAELTAVYVEADAIDGAVNGFARLVRQFGGRLRRLQSGYVRNYALGISAGLVVILAYLLSRTFS